MKFLCYCLVMVSFFWPKASFGQGTFGIGNGSFEAVTFTPNVKISPWIWTGCLMLLMEEPEHVADGRNCAIVCGRIYQDVQVVPGNWYQLRFAFGGDDGAQVNAGPLTVGWGSQTVASIPVDPVSMSSPRWRYLTFDVLATSGSMRLSFSTLPSQAYPLLDDVSLTAIAEPGVLSLCSTAGILGFAMRTRFRRRWCA